MIIDFYKGNGGGGGTGSQGPIGPQGPQGIEGAQGYQGAEGAQGPASSGSTGDFNKLMAVPAFPESADTGDAVAKIMEESREVVGDGVQFDDGIDLAGMTVSYIYVDDANGVEFSFDGGRWSISWANEEFSLNLVDGEDNITGVYTIETKGDSEEGWDINIQDGEENLLWNMFIDKVYEINDNGFGSDYTVPAGTEGTVNYTGYETFNVVDGVWQYSPVSGAIAEWSNIPERNGNDVRSFALSFDYIPDGTELFRVKYFNATYYTKLVYSGNALYTFTEEDGYTSGTYLCSMNDSGATLAVSQGSSTHPKLLISKHNIAFYQHQSSGFGLFFWEGFWNCIATGAHWFRVDRPAPKLYLGGTHSGLLAANDAGQIIGWPTDQPTKRTNKINNGYVNVYAGNNVPNIWAPTDGGTAGQMLISNGTSAPTWTNWIKSVQISADAYEALQIKDPNTLYLIVNE